MSQQEKFHIRFAGIDYFDRAVFVTTDGKHYFKSLELMPSPDFHALSSDEKETLLHTLCDTDEFEGEPGYNIQRENFTLAE